MRAIAWTLVCTRADNALLEAGVKGTFKNCEIGERGLDLPVTDERELGGSPPEAEVILWQLI